MQFRQLLITGSAIVLGCLLSLILFIAILAYSHERWLPSVVNNVFFSEPLADFPADSFRLESVQLKSWQRLKQLSLSGPENSTLTVEGVSWPLSGRLVLDRLDIRLPDQLPASKDNPQSAGAPKTVIVGTVSPTPHDAVTEASPLSGWQKGELSLRPEYQQFYQQLDAVFVQLEAFRQQYQLHTLTIRSLNIQGLPLDHSISLQYFRGAIGSEEDTAYWQLNLTSKGAVKEGSAANQFVFDLRGQLSPVQHKLDVSLQHPRQFAQNLMALPPWLSVSAILQQAKQSLEQHSIVMTGADIRLALLFKPPRADLAIRLPAFEYQGIAPCNLAFDTRSISLSYLTGDDAGNAAPGNKSSKTEMEAQEQIRFSFGDALEQVLPGDCLRMLAGHEERSQSQWLKGLDPTSLGQGGRFSLKLSDAISVYPGSKQLRLGGLNARWQPEDTQAPAVGISLSEIRVTPERLRFTLLGDFAAELKPRSEFANQSRKLDLSFLMNTHVALDVPAYLAAPDQPLALIQQAQVEIQQSELSLNPALGDDAVLWAPAQLEYPLLQHRGSWSLRLNNPNADKALWALTHQGKGETLIRHPALKQNLRLPYNTGFEFSGPLATENTPQLLAELEGSFNAQLVEQMSLISSRASAPNKMIPEFSVDLILGPQHLRVETQTQVELARLAEWMALPSGAQITDGVTDAAVSLVIPKQELFRLSAQSGDDWLSEVEGSGTLDVKQLTGQAKGYEFSGVTLPMAATVSGGQWQVSPTRLSIDRIFAGVELTRLGMDLKASGVLNDESMPLQAQVTEFSADTLGGSVHLAQLNYPFSKDKTSDLMLDKLDLSQLIALGDKQIKVTGLLNGTLPLLLSDQGVTIRQGQVIGKEGEIILQDNPAWQAMLQQQPVLASQLKHLNHLHYDLLQGDIAMEADGQLTAELTIKGENRAESQPVNLNFTSEQNILTLLKALRLSDQIDKSLSESAQGMYQ